MKKIKFTVLMSIYINDKKCYVENAINSIINQTLLPNQFVIIVDGPISEDLKKILNDYKKKYSFIDLFFRDVNLGLGKTLNEGLKLCKYDYIARMDADDESKLNRFEEQIKYLEKHPEVDAIGCNIAEYDENMNDIVSYRVVPETNEKIRKFLKKRNPFNHPTVIFKKKSVLKVGGYEDYPYFEDYYLWSKMIANNCIMHNSQKYLYKFRAGSSMFKRRGGYKYLKCIKKFEKGLFNLKIISKKEYYINVSKRYIGALIPNWLRQFLYMKLLRKKKVS